MTAKRFLSLVAAFLLAIPHGAFAGDASHVVTRGEFLTGYYSTILAGAPASSAYIELYYSDVGRATPLARALQKAVYYGLLPNRPTAIGIDAPVTDTQFANAVRRDTAYQLNGVTDAPLTEDVFEAVLADMKSQGIAYAPPSATPAPIINVTPTVPSYAVEQNPNFAILNDVYLQLRRGHVGSGTVTDEQLVQGAVKGMVSSLGDEFSAYFPPSENQDFMDSLQGNVEGIGAYVDMDTPGKLVVIAPIRGTPAEAAGLKAGDIITAIDGKPVTGDMNVSAATALIKGPSGTNVVLSVKRGEETLSLTITRAQIHIPFVTYERLATGENLIRVSLFGTTVANEFQTALDQSLTNNGRVIIDLRNNPGGSLEQVESMLYNVVPKGEAMVETRTRDGVTVDTSYGVELPPLADREVVILINKGSASASEIFALVSRDYLPKLRILGTTSYGKGSVQTLLPYADGSALKFTTAKWYSGKSKTTIDHVGIVPDTVVEVDAEQAKKDIDNQLEAAKSLKF